MKYIEKDLIIGPKLVMYILNFRKRLLKNQSFTFNLGFNPEKQEATYKNIYATTRLAAISTKQI